MAGWRTQVGDFANVFKAFIGTNYLSLPYGFLISGLGFGIIGLLVVAFLTDYACLIIVKCKYDIINDICQNYKNSQPDVDVTRKTKKLQDRLTKHLGYDDLVGLTFGKFGMYIINFCIIVTQAGFCMNYFIVIGNTMQTLFPLEAVNMTWNATVIVQSPTQNLNESVLQNLKSESAHLDFLQGIHDTQLHSNPELGESNSRSIDYQDAKNNTRTASVYNIAIPKQTPLISSANVINTKQASNEEWSIASMPWGQSNGQQTETIKHIPESTINLNQSTDTSESLVYTLLRTTSPSVALLVVIPLPLMILFSWFRDVRQLSGVSIVANSCALLGFTCVVVYLCLDFEMSDDIMWWIPSGLLVYIAQATGAFEAIALILPVEASMHGNWHMFTPFVHVTVVLMCLIILVIAIIGYLSFGPATNQLILVNLPTGEPLTIVTNLLLIIGVACTYPLQIIPVVQIMENALFGEKNEPEIEAQVLEVDDEKNEESPLLQNSSGSMDARIDEVDDPFQLSVAYHIPKAIPAWKRNLFRAILAVTICGMAVVLRNVLAYSSALIGALGSCPLAYIIPCSMYIKLQYHNMNRSELILNIFIIAFGSVFCVVGIVLALMNIVEKA